MKELKLKDVPGLRPYPCYIQWYRRGEVKDMIFDFLMSDAEAIEVEYDRNRDVLSEVNTLLTAVKRYKVDHRVKVHRYNGNVYLVKVEAKKDGKK